MVVVVVVTYNSDSFIRACLSYLAKQTYPIGAIVVVDNNSRDRTCLRQAAADSHLPIKLVELDYNLGYAGGANAATRHFPSTTDHVLYVGPDTYLADTYLAEGIDYLNAPGNEGVAAVSGKLLGYDNERSAPTGLIDSTGVGQKWYGRWYDRGQGEKESEASSCLPQEVAALCGTAILCKRGALRALEDREPFTVYDSSFFMYKEDIDLSLRLKDAGFSLRYNPRMIAYHCRGWNRSKMSQRAKILSARNEAQLNAKLGLMKYIFSCIKLYAVTHWPSL